MNNKSLITISVILPSAAYLIGAFAQATFTIDDWEPNARYAWAIVVGAAELIILCIYGQSQADKEKELRSGSPAPFYAIDIPKRHIERFEEMLKAEDVPYSLHEISLYQYRLTFEDWRSKKTAKDIYTDNFH